METTFSPPRGSPPLPPSSHHLLLVPAGASASTQSSLVCNCEECSGNTECTDVLGHLLFIMPDSYYANSYEWPCEWCEASDVPAFRDKFFSKIFDMVGRVDLYLCTSLCAFDLANLAWKLRFFDASLRSDWIGVFSEVPNYALTDFDSRKTGIAVGSLLRSLLVDRSIDLRLPFYLCQISRFRAFVLRELDTRFPLKPEPRCTPFERHGQSEASKPPASVPPVSLRGKGGSGPAKTPAVARDYPGEGGSAPTASVLPLSLRCKGGSGPTDETVAVARVDQGDGESAPTVTPEDTAHGEKGPVDETSKRARLA